MSTLVTVVVPVLQEAETVGATLDSLARQTVGCPALEVLVYDGGSTDGTLLACESARDAHPWGHFELNGNRAGTVAPALNAGLQASRSPYFMRVDARTRLSRNYVETCLAALDRTKASAVGGQLRAEAEGPVAESIAAAVTHRFGVGTGFRTPHERQTAVPHHPFALWRTETVRALGGFDPALTRNQDDEFSMRARRTGTRIMLVPEAVVFYRPRERFRGLATQYFQYGLWKGAVGNRKRLFPVRSAVPATVAMAALGAIASLPRSRRPALFLAGVYAALGSAASKDRRDADPLLTGCALAALHVSYGIGVLAGAVAPSLTQTRLGCIRIR